MPLWLLIMLIGAGGCGWLLLKAREQEAVNVKKRLKQGSKTLKDKAKKASGEIGMPPVEPYEILEAGQEVQMSRDASSKVAKQLEEIMKEKGL